MESGRTAPPILNLELGWSDQLRVPLVLHHREERRYPLNRKMGGSYSQFGRYEDGKEFSPVPEIEPRLLGCSACSVVTVPSNGN